MAGAHGMPLRQATSSAGKSRSRSLPIAFLAQARVPFSRVHPGRSSCLPRTIDNERAHGSENGVGAKLTILTGVMSADQALSTPNQWYILASVSLIAGTWLITAVA